MPTGYTSDLYDGKEVSLRDFILRCSRAMGASVLLRDYDLGVLPTVENINGGSFENYYRRRLEEARAELDHWKNLAGPELAAETESFNAKQREGREEDERKRRRISTAYTTMLAEVEGWEPPTPDHQGLKKFMIEQLNDSLRHDASPTDPKWYREYLPGDLRDMKIGNLTREIERLEVSADEEDERNRGRVAWVAALYESLPPAKEEVPA